MPNVNHDRSLDFTLTSGVLRQMNELIMKTWLATRRADRITTTLSLQRCLMLNALVQYPGQLRTNCRWVKITRRVYIKDCGVIALPPKDGGAIHRDKCSDAEFCSWIIP